jgi:hypothetical protein
MFPKPRGLPSIKMPLHGRHQRLVARTNLRPLQICIAITGSNHNSLLSIGDWRGIIQRRSSAGTAGAFCTRTEPYLHAASTALRPLRWPPLLVCTGHPHHARLTSPSPPPSSPARSQFFPRPRAGGAAVVLLARPHHHHHPHPHSHIHPAAPLPLPTMTVLLHRRSKIHTHAHTHVPAARHMSERPELAGTH